MIHIENESMQVVETFICQPKSESQRDFCFDLEQVSSKSRLHIWVLWWRNLCNFEWNWYSLPRGSYRFSNDGATLPHDSTYPHVCRTWLLSKGYILVAFHLELTKHGICTSSIGVCRSFSYATPQACCYDSTIVRSTVLDMKNCTIFLRSVSGCRYLSKLWLGKCTY